MTTVTEAPAEVEQPAEPERANLIAGLRELADFLQANPHIPAPQYPTLSVHPAISDPDEKRYALVHNIARALGVEVEVNGDHLIAPRMFGPVRYEAVAVGAGSMQTWNAAMEYRKNLTAAAALAAEAAAMVAAVLTPDDPALPAEVADWLANTSTPPRSWSAGEVIDADVDEVTDSDPDQPGGVWRRCAEGGWRWHSPQGGSGRRETEDYVLKRFGPCTEVVA